jgi:two-component system, response regulator PdtaR
MTNTRIMIVEDEWTVAEDIKISLQSLGYTVTSITSSGEEAIQKAEEDRPDLVLMDIVLQGEMDGIEAANQIRSRFNIPIVYLTAYADEKILERAKITEPFGYIVKPFINEDLKIAIEIALYKHKAEKERK